MSPITTAKWTLILGIAFIFITFGVEKYMDAANWVHFIPHWMDGILGYGGGFWLKVIGGLEIAYGVMVLVPVRLVQKIGSALTSLHLVAVLTQSGWNETAIRDSGLLCMTTALWYLI